MEAVMATGPMDSYSKLMWLTSPEDFIANIVADFMLSPLFHRHHHLMN
jgi:hypothetical protein